MVLILISILLEEVNSKAKVRIKTAERVYCISQGGSGDFTGRDWLNTMSTLPESLVRGATYYISSGKYPSRIFDDPVKGDTYISIKAATHYDHGPDLGWNNEFEGLLVFGPILFTVPFYRMDGTKKKLIEVNGSFLGTVVSIKTNKIELSNCKIDGEFRKSLAGKHIQGACNGITVSGSDVSIKECEIYDIADDGVEIHNAKRLLFTGNTIRRLNGCGTDGGCGPCYNGHSDGLEIYNVSDSEISYNFITDIKGNAALFFGNWGALCRNLKIYNNIFYSPDTGFAAYISDCDNVQFINNIVWGTEKGGYGGLAIGKRVRKLDIYNNIILSINYKHMGATYDKNNHKGGYNLFGKSLGQYYISNTDIINGEPMFNKIPGVKGKSIKDAEAKDFILQNGSSAIDNGFMGNNTIKVPLYDFIGKKRIEKINIGAW